MGRKSETKEINQIIKAGTTFLKEIKSLLEFFTTPPPAPRQTVSPDSGQDPYKDLGVTKSMSLKEIEKIYRNLVLIYHPDRGKIDIEKIKEINNAWESIYKEKRKKR